MARQHRISPDEVRLVFARYAAHRDHQKSGGALALPQWFRFYRMEKSSEGAQAGPAPQGCSIDSDAVNNACIERPSEFLQVLQAYAAQAA